MQQVDGTYPPGERLLELQLAEEFESSQAPAREALRELEALQDVESLPHRGTRVRTVAPTEMRDAYRVRAALERVAAEAAAQGPSADWRQLRATVSGIVKAAATRDLRAYVRHDEAFHRTLVERADNPVLLHHWELLLVATRALVVLRSGIVDLRRAAAQHGPILDAVEKGEVALAGRLAFEHANHIAECLDKALRQGGEGGVQQQSPPGQ
ncbi:MAG: GntR family transcriptional regulator [Gemmatimonadales bacterium]